jgi:DMSO/TMAO reductase YedYZ molybdopterin-dependent catalytic subunit
LIRIARLSRAGREWIREYRLEIGGLVDKPSSFRWPSYAMPSRTQITRHDCVEGWSAIGKWKGASCAALDVVH